MVAKVFRDFCGVYKSRENRGIENFIKVNILVHDFIKPHFAFGLDEFSYFSRGHLL